MATASGERHAPTFVTVVIPVRNGGSTLGAQLDALAKQNYEGAWELVVADNGSTDDTSKIVEQHAHQFATCRVVDASQRSGSSYARNVGAREAHGDFLAFCDADDEVAPTWLAGLASGAQQFDAVTGVQDASRINSVLVQAWRPERVNDRVATALGFLPFAPSCNLGVWKSLFINTGGFAEDYPQAHDVEWSWRAQLSGYSLGFNPNAIVHYRYRDTAKGILRQGYVSGVDAVRLYRDYRDRGLQPTRLLRALRTWLWIFARSYWALLPARRGTWCRRSAEAAGRLRGSMQFRVIYL